MRLNMDVLLSFCVSLMQHYSPDNKVSVIDSKNKFILKIIKTSLGPLKSYICVCENVPFLEFIF